MLRGRWMPSPYTRHEMPHPPSIAMGTKYTKLSARTRRVRTRQAVVVVLLLCLVLYCYHYARMSDSSKGRIILPLFSPRADRPHRHHPDDLLNSLSLTGAQCTAAFPGLTKEIDDEVARGPFALRRAGGLGPLQARVRDGHMYIIDAQRNEDLSREMRNSRTAALHQLHRALLTAPAHEPVPDTVFAVNIQDTPFGAAFQYSRAADPALHSSPSTSPATRDFLMPHFSFWAWPLPFVGSMARASAAMAALEARLPFAAKSPRAVWRGTPWFASAHAPRLRQDLLAVAAGRDWADVEALRWDGGDVGDGEDEEGGSGGSSRGNNKKTQTQTQKQKQKQKHAQPGVHNASNALAVEDFCRYRYVVHTEGVAYSGRFQYLQQCASVVLSPPVAWLQHLTHLARPVWSSSLPGLDAHRPGREQGKQGDPHPSARARRSWPVDWAPAQATMVFVAPDWSDLEATVRWLEAHPDVAEGIARRQRDLFVGGGYFSPAAEVCYWRALVRGWSKVVRPEGRGWDDEGTPWELWSLTEG